MKDYAAQFYFTPIGVRSGPPIGQGIDHVPKRRHKPDPQRKFFLFCEGKNTEPGYFDAMKRMFRHSQIEIQTIRAAGVPCTIADKAIAFRKGIQDKIDRSKTNSFEEGDEVWAVFDRDAHGSYYNAAQRCEQAGVGVAKSNPCFEVWLILHEQEFDKSVGRAAVAKHLQKIRKDYNARRKTLDFDELLTRLPDAERRAIQQMKARIAELGGRLNPPYTTVNRLTKAISSPLRLCL